MPIEAFERLADPKFARDTAYIMSGYGAAAGVDLAIEQFSSRSFPNEASGLAVVAGAEYAPVVSGMQKRHVQLGGGAYAALALADRIGVRDAVEGAL